MFIGVDIGRYGAISIINNNFELIDVIKMPSQKEVKTNIPNFNELNCELKKYLIQSPIVLIEEQQGYRGENIKSIFTLARYYQAIIDLVNLYSLEYYLISPKKWKKSYFLSSNKYESIIRAVCLYPALRNIIHKNRNGNYDKFQDGIAESVLIADYLAKHYNHKKGGIVE